MASKTNPSENLSGLMLFGTVTARNRRKFDGKEGKSPRWNIALHIMTDNGLFKPERWSDIPMPADCPVVGNAVQLPVNIVTYDKKNGTGYRLTWGNSNDAESF